MIENYLYLDGCLKSYEGGILSPFVRQFYLDTTAIPPEIHPPAPLHNQDVAPHWLCSKPKSPIQFAIPTRSQIDYVVDG